MKDNKYLVDFDQISSINTQNVDEEYYSEYGFIEARRAKKWLGIFTTTPARPTGWYTGRSDYHCECFASAEELVKNSPSDIFFENNIFKRKAYIEMQLKNKNHYSEWFTSNKDMEARLKEIKELSKANLQIVNRT